MRRVFSILLALTFGFGPVAFAFGYDEDASLPACCRRHGSHHCAMSAEDRANVAQAEPDTAEFTAPAYCPLFPLHGNASPTAHFGIVDSAYVAIRVVEKARAEVRSDVRPDSRHPGIPALRGPPISRIA